MQQTINKVSENISSEVSYAIISVDSCEGIIKQSAAEGSKKACTCTSTVKSKSSSLIKVSQLSGDNVNAHI